MKRTWLGPLACTLVLFLAAIVASSLIHSWRGPFTKWLLRNRRQLGFSFGVAHFCHMGFVALFEHDGNKCVNAMNHAH